jgi:thiamine-phosphate pyrophosphorylase
MKIYAIANLEEAPSVAFWSRVRDLAACGVDFVQLRGKQLPAAELARIGERMRREIPAGGTRFIVNGRPDVALCAGADGVHLPADGLPVAVVRYLSDRLLVGRSCHSVEEVRLAARDGADYALLGPVFPARSKCAPAGAVLDQLADAATAGIELFALGGISRENLQELRGTGISGVAAITLFMEDQPLRDIVEAVRTL